ncbi:DUF5309 family protein [Alkalibacillus sp. S2W]|uniref:SU10 major capsid protein n=1 Tax=Alkalibacillus sp. S2W TaxID=3386553 RepID=UPI00398D0F35
MPINTTYDVRNLPEDLRNFALHNWDDTPFYSMVLARGVETINSTRIEWSEKFNNDHSNKDNAEGQGKQESDTFTGGDNFSNYTQIYHEAVDYSTSQLAVENGKQIKTLHKAEKYGDIKGQINESILTGKKSDGDGNKVRKTGGLITAVSTNVVNAGTEDGSGGFNSGELTKQHIEGPDGVLRKIVKNTKRKLRNHVIFVNAPLLLKINEIYGVEPASRTEGGLAVSRIITVFGAVDVVLDQTIPEDVVLVSKMDKNKINVLPTHGQNLYEGPEEKSGLQVYQEMATEQTFKFGHEAWHGVITNAKY